MLSTILASLLHSYTLPKLANFVLFYFSHSLLRSFTSMAWVDVHLFWRRTSIRTDQSVMCSTLRWESRTLVRRPAGTSGWASRENSCRQNCSRRKTTSSGKPKFSFILMCISKRSIETVTRYNQLLLYDIRARSLHVKTDQTWFIKFTQIEHANRILCKK